MDPNAQWQPLASDQSGARGQHQSFQHRFVKVPRNTRAGLEPNNLNERILFSVAVVGAVAQLLPLLSLPRWSPPTCIIVAIAVGVALVDATGALEHPFSRERSLPPR